MIPKNVKNKFEFFTGFGFKELFITVAGLVTGIIIFFFLMLFTKSIPIRIFIAFWFPVIAFFGSRPNPRTGRTVFAFMKDYRIYKSKQKTYFYEFGKGRVTRGNQ